MGMAYISYDEDNDTSTYPEDIKIYIRIPTRYWIVEPDPPQKEEKEIIVPDPDYPLKYVSLPIPPHKEIGKPIDIPFVILRYTRKQICSKNGFLARKARLRKKGKA